MNALSAMLALTPCGCNTTKADSNAVISLAGRWRVALDSDDVGHKEEWFADSAATKFADTVKLPGSLGDAELGPEFDAESFFPDQPLREMEPKARYQVLEGLQRRYNYIGAAWYRRTVDIPDEWRGQRVVLYLERVQWGSEVWLDEQYIGSGNAMSTPHEYEIMRHATPGTHQLVVRVDNRKQVRINNLSHGYSQNNASIWNGIAGRIEIRKTPLVWIEELQLIPDAKTRTLKVSLRLGGHKRNQGPLQVHCRVPELQAAATATSEFTNDSTAATVLMVDLGTKAKLWDEFNPQIYELKVQLRQDNQMLQQRTVTFGLRDISTKHDQLLVNGRPTFLRGTHDAICFPRTGYPAMDTEEWQRIFRQMKACGLNHIRFHSITPPAACFSAADREGIYVQAELPLWDFDIGLYPNIEHVAKRDAWLKNEAERILKTYGHHPSFVMFTFGNEIKGDYDYLQNWLKDVKARYPGRLYALCSNQLYAKHNLAKDVQSYDDFAVERQVNGQAVRGRVYGSPTTAFDYDAALKGLDQPLITHEVGQWAVFPSMAQIAEYTGTLRPANLEVIRRDLRQSGLLDQAEEFNRASAAFVVELYKAEMEAALRSRHISGFQLLDLHDYAGQGTAHVGVLDSFWNAKSGVDIARFRTSTAPVTVLARIKQRILTSGTPLTAEIEIANFGAQRIEDAQPYWTVTGTDGTPVAHGTLAASNLPMGERTGVGQITVPTSSVEHAEQWTLQVSLPSTAVANQWRLWVYPNNAQVPPPESVVFTSDLTRALKALETGKRVLFVARRENICQPVDSRFLPVFWSPVYFQKQPGTMGLLIRNSHPALADFPTAEHSDWQWQEIADNAPAIALTDLPETGRPIVQAIDGFHRNHKLALVFEAQVGKGQLLATSIDLLNHLNQRPVTRQLRASLLRYLAANRKLEHAPRLTPERLRRIFKYDTDTPATAKQDSNAQENQDANKNDFEAPAKINTPGVQL